MSRELDEQIQKSKQGLYKNKAIEIAMRELGDEYIGGFFCGSASELRTNEILLSLQNDSDCVFKENNNE